MKDHLRVAAVQTSSISDTGANRERMRDLIGRASLSGAKLVVLPENAHFRGTRDEVHRHAEEVPGPWTEYLSEIAKAHSVWILGGTIAERDGEDDRTYNTAPLIDDSGNLAASYRKIHLFDIDLPGIRIEESRVHRPGTRLVLADIEGWRTGILICYDLRFPGAFTALRRAGAEIILLPANFTMKTGRAHWEILLRARAIENQVYIAAAAQWGIHPGLGTETHGRSMIIDPWGRVLAEAEETGDAVLTADLDRNLLERTRREMPVMEHERPESWRP